MLLHSFAQSLDDASDLALNFTILAFIAGARLDLARCSKQVLNGDALENLDEESCVSGDELREQYLEGTPP